MLNLFVADYLFMDYFKLCCPSYPQFNAISRKYFSIIFQKAS